MATERQGGERGTEHAAGGKGPWRSGHDQGRKQARPGVAQLLPNAIGGKNQRHVEELPDDETLENFPPGQRRHEERHERLQRGMAVPVPDCLPQSGKTGRYEAAFLVDAGREELRLIDLQWTFRAELP